MLVLLWILPSTSHGKPIIPENPALSRYLVNPSSTAVMTKIAEKYEVELRRGDGFQIIVPAPEAQELLRLVPNAVLLEPDITQALKERLKKDRAGWHTFDSVLKDLDKIESVNFELATVETYGKSMEGRPLKALRLLSAVPLRGKKPRIVITGATHGNELITVEVVFGLLQKLLDGYRKDARLTKIVDDHELYFIPVVNADGYSRYERYCNGVDPNRNYPWPENPDRQPNPAIKSIMDFFANHDVRGSLDYHSTGGMIMYPWAYTYDQIPSDDDTAFDLLTTKMAKFNGYSHGPISKTIYIAKGSSADYYYWKFKTKAIAIEISSDGSSSMIPSLLDENTESTWAFIESFSGNEGSFAH